MYITKISACVLYDNAFKFMAYKQKRSYSKESLENAIASCKSENLKVREAAKLFGVPKNTSHDHVNGKYDATCAGGPTVLQLKVEQEIVASCQILAEI